MILHIFIESKKYNLFGILLKEHKMKIFKCIISVCVIAIILMSGCSSPQTQSEKQSRLTAAENMELREELKQRDAAVEMLKTQQKKELEEQKKLLAKAQEEIEQWKQKSQQNVRGQVQDILDTVLQQNAGLRKEIETLTKQVSAQQSMIKQLEKELSEKRDNI